MTNACVDIATFARQLFDSMVWAANEGIGAPMMFGVIRSGTVMTQPLPDGAERLLSNGEAKDAIFRYWRELCEDEAITAFACGSWVWSFHMNDDANSLADPKFRALIDHGFRKLTALGYGEVEEALMVVAQTRNSVLFLERKLKRGENGEVLWTAEMGSHESSQADFKGRQKMWGDLRPENLS